MENDQIEELSQKAEIFRSKLIEDFQLLDTLKSKGSIESPRFYSNEIQGILQNKNNKNTEVVYHLSFL